MNNYQLGDKLNLPIAHGEGRYQCSTNTLKELEDSDSIALSYINNPNGSIQNIAGITNKKGNVLGLMPHPERACETISGSLDGKLILESLLSQ